MDKFPGKKNLFPNIKMLVLAAAAALVLCACGGGSGGTAGGPAGGGSGSTSGNGSGSSGGGGNMTLLVYMIGSDLESLGGCASLDIQEMISASPGKNVRVILQTGGSKEWLSYGISNEKIQRYELTGSGLALLEEKEDARMSESDTLADFLKWGNENYPADRMAVIMWNHGGGSALGYGHDELHPESMLTLPGIGAAFKEAGSRYAFIGFDACLMSTVETACTLADYADYLIASEETEPGDGWFYTNWLSKLEKDPGLSMEEIGKAITEDFIAQKDSHPYDSYTLAVTRLDKIRGFMEKLSAYFEESAGRIEKGEYNTFASARVRSKDFGGGHYEQIDVGDYLAQVDPEGTSGLNEALKECIVCFETNLEGTSGLAMYYPYHNLPLYSKMMQTISEIGYPGSYFDFFNSFCSVLSIADAENPVPYQDQAGITVKAPEKAAGSAGTGAAGAGSAGSSDGPIASQYAAYPWYRADIVKQYYPEASLNSHEAILEQDGQDVFDCFYWIHLPEKLEWKNIWYREDRFLMDDGEKLLYMGTKGEQDLLTKDLQSIVYAPIWYCYGNTVVPCFFQYFEERNDGLLNAVHYIPAVLNGGEKIQIAMKEDRATGEINILGYFIEDVVRENEGIRIPPKAYLKFKEGDELQFPVDSYDYDYHYLGTVLLDDKIVIGENGHTLTKGYTGNHSARISLVLRDIYNNYISTPWVEHKKKDAPELPDDVDSRIAEAAPGNDTDVVGLSIPCLSCGFKIRNDTPLEIHNIFLKRADFPEDRYEDILYEPIPPGKSAAYADILENMYDWDCAAWSLKVCDASGKVNQKEIVFNPWVAEEIAISWNNDSGDFETEVTYSEEGSYKKDIAGCWNWILYGQGSEPSDANAFLSKVPDWSFTIENQGKDVIIHMYIIPTDQDVSDKMKEIYDKEIYDSFGKYSWIDCLTALVLPGESHDYDWPIIYEDYAPFFAMAVIDNEASILDAEPIVPFPVWKVYFEDLSGNKSEIMEFRPWETSKIVIKEKAGDTAAGDGIFYDCEFTP